MERRATTQCTKVSQETEMQRRADVCPIAGGWSPRVVAITVQFFALHQKCWNVDEVAEKSFAVRDEKITRAAFPFCRFREAFVPSNVGFPRFLSPLFSYNLIMNICFLLLQYGSDEFGQDSPRYTSPKALYTDSYYLGKRKQELHYSNKKWENSRYTYTSILLPPIKKKMEFFGMNHCFLEILR